MKCEQQFLTSFNDRNKKKYVRGQAITATKQKQMPWAMAVQMREVVKVRPVYKYQTHTLRTFDGLNRKSMICT